MDENDEKPFADMIRRSESAVFKEYRNHFERSASFESPTPIRELFESYHRHFFDEPRPSFTVDWGEASPNWKWQKRHSQTFMDSLQSAVAGVHYHRENMARIEREILAFPKRAELQAMLGASAMGGGNTRKLDFEYHAFIFAYRRALDYLARGIASLLKEEFHSFNSLPGSLRKHEKREWVRQIVAMQARCLPRLESFLSGSGVKSTRDLLAHYMNVPAGVLNVNVNGIFFAGGGQKLTGVATLESVLDRDMETLEGIIRETFEAIKGGFPKGA